MPHDEQLVGAFYDLAQGMRLHSCLDPRILFCHHALSAEVGELIPFLYDRLVAASAEGEVDSVTRIIVIFRIAARADAKADT